MKKNETYAEWLRRKQSELVAYKYMNEKDLRKEARAKERLSKRSVYTISGGLPSLGKRR